MKSIYNHFTILCCLFTLNLTNVNAQQIQAVAKTTESPYQAGKEKIEAMRVAFITNKMALTPEEAEKFFPIYNQYRSDIRELHKGGKDRSNDIDKRIALQERELAIKKSFTEKFKAIVPEAKINLLFDAEKEFIDMIKKASDRQ